MDGEGFLHGFNGEGFHIVVGKSFDSRLSLVNNFDLFLY